jgi:hypothetical protein
MASSDIGCQTCLSSVHNNIFSSSANNMISPILKGGLSTPRDEYAYPNIRQQLALRYAFLQ